MRTGLNLVLSSTYVLAETPALLAVAFQAVVLSSLVVLANVWAIGGRQWLEEPTPMMAVAILPSVLAGFVIYAVFSAVISSCAFASFRGDEVSVMAGWRRALARIGVLVGYALVRLIERILAALLAAVPFVGRFLADAADWAFDAATYLAIPLILHDRSVGPVTAMTGSARLVKAKLGTNVVVHLAIGLVLSVVALPVAAVLGAIGYLALGSWGMWAGVIVAAVLLELVGMAVNAVVSVAMYRYVALGWSTPEFSSSDMRQVFATRS